MRPRTSAWTERHARTAMVVAVALAASVAGIAEGGGIPLWVAAAVALTAVVSLALDGLGGCVVGLAAAAAVIAAKRLVGPWGPESFWLSLLQTSALIATGVVAGAAGQALRAHPRHDQPPLLPLPAFGSLGLLDGDAARARLEEEVERAQRHRRPLGLFLLDVEVIDESLDAKGRRSALRAVARILESWLPDADVPFAVTPDRLGAILPERNASQAWDVVGQVVEAAAEGRFTFRSEGGTRPLGDAVRITVGLASLGGRATDADALLDMAVAGLRGSADGTATGVEGGQR